MERVLLDHGTLRLDVRSHREHRTFLAPFDDARLTSARRRPRIVARRHALARAAGLVGRRLSFGLPLTLLDADIDLLPYQIEPLLASLAGRRRLLIADEVGLGKTIEAGLVVAELMRRETAARILVLVPASLRAQWQDELRRRFGIAAELADAAGLSERTHAAALGTDPWAGTGVRLTSIDYVKQPHVQAALPTTPWDLVVIDEAHDACGNSERHEACAALAQNARQVLLLTATPHSGDESRFHRLTHLGALGTHGDDLVIFQRTRDAATIEQHRRVRWRRVKLTAAHRQVLDALSRVERTLHRASTGAHAEAVALLMSVFRKRALSTLAALGASLAHRLAVLDMRAHAGVGNWIQPPLPIAEDDDIAEDERAALTVVTGIAEDRERSCLARLERVVNLAVQGDAKLHWLRRTLARVCEPVVIFTEFRRSLWAVEQCLHGVRTVAVLHGGQSSSERAASLQRFDGQVSSVLIATDVAGQGLNLQKGARWVISLEVPWNPVRLEQRVGRVDRIGQRRRVHATILLADDAERPLLSRFSRRLEAARQSIGQGALAAMTLPSGMQSIPPRDAEMSAIGERLSSSLVSTDVWRRRARAIVRAVHRRRSLLSSWRTPETDSARMWITRSHNLGAPDRARRCLVSIPLLDATGLEIDRMLIVFETRLDAATVRALHRARALDALWARRIGSRLRRLTHLSRALAEARSATERALADRRRTADENPPVSLGLFDRRELRALERAQRDTEARFAAMTRWVTTACAHARLSPGEPRIEIIAEDCR